MLSWDMQFWESYNGITRDIPERDNSVFDGISRDIPLQILRITRDIPVFSRFERGDPGYACLCTLKIAPECSNRTHNHLDQVMQALFFIRGGVWFLYPGAPPRPRRHRPGQPRGAEAWEPRRPGGHRSPRPLGQERLAAAEGLVAPSQSWRTPFRG